MKNNNTFEALKNYIEAELHRARYFGNTRAEMINSCGIMLGSVSYAYHLGLDVSFEEMDAWWDEEIREVCWNGTFGEEYRAEVGKL